MEKELEEGQEIKQSELFQRGWEKMGPYANLVVFCKDERTLFFNPETKRIDQIFEGR